MEDEIKPTKPLLFGAQTLSADQLRTLRESERENDSSYVPVYAEIRAENEHRVRKGEKPTVIPNLRWIRDQNPTGGTVDYRERLTEQTLGYDAVDLETLKDLGFGMPPSASIDPNGAIRRMDTVLAVVSPELHAENVSHAERKALEARSRGAPEGIDVHENHTGKDQNAFGQSAGPQPK